MKITDKDIKRIAKEELKKILKENLYNQSLEKIKQRLQNEPEAWKSELGQYGDMLYDGMYEEFFSLIEDEPSILAYFIENSTEKAELFGFLGRAQSNYPNSSALIRDYLQSSLDSLADLMKAAKNPETTGVAPLRKINQFLLEDNILRGFLGIGEIMIFDNEDDWYPWDYDDEEYDKEGDPRSLEQDYTTSGTFTLRLKFMVDAEKVKLFGINKSDFEKESVEYIRNMWHEGLYKQYEFKTEPWRGEGYHRMAEKIGGFSVNRGIDPKGNTPEAKVSDYIESGIKIRSNLNSDGFRHTDGPELSLGFIASSGAEWMEGRAAYIELKKRADEWRKKVEQKIIYWIPKAGGLRTWEDLARFMVKVIDNEGWGWYGNFFHSNEVTMSGIINKMEEEGKIQLDYGKRWYVNKD